MAQVTINYLDNATETILRVGEPALIHYSDGVGHVSFFFNNQWHVVSHFNAKEMRSVSLVTDDELDVQIKASDMSPELRSDSNGDSDVPETPKLIKVTINGEWRVYPYKTQLTYEDIVEFVYGTRTGRPTVTFYEPRGEGGELVPGDKLTIWEETHIDCVYTNNA